MFNQVCQSRTSTLRGQRCARDGEDDGWKKARDESVRAEAVPLPGQKRALGWRFVSTRPSSSAPHTPLGSLFSTPEGGSAAQGRPLVGQQEKRVHSENVERKMVCQGYAERGDSYYIP